MNDQRHDKRIALMQTIFACTFSDDQLQVCLADETNEVRDLLLELTDLDLAIQSAAPERPIKDINKVDLAILRLLVFESKHKNTPKKVIINEGVELAKEFGSETSSKFVNGVLAKLLIEQE